MEHHTTTQLQKMVAERTGQPCNSRNREALIRKLAKMDEGAAQLTVTRDGKAVGAAVMGSDGVVRASVAKPVRKPKPKPATKKPRAGSTHHAAALAFVRKAMARKSPPSLRALCEEMKRRGIQKPRGGTDWWPSSVQNLMRQVQA